MQSATRRQIAGVACLGTLGIAATALASPATLLARLDGLAARPPALLAVVTAAYLLRPFLLWPVSALSVALGYLYGSAVALPLALAGAGVTALPPFLLARYADTGAGPLASLAATGRDLVDAVGETRGVLAARLLPIPGDPVSYAAGLSGISLGPYVAGTVLGELPWVVVTVLTGDSMRTLTLSGASLGPRTILAIAGLAILVLAGPVYARLRDGSVLDP
jgi:uncharacterized membrane protein YdjX (TVP38/TMEM64 family)